MAGRIAYYGNISPQGLVLNLDAAIVGSYPRTGSTWFDISNNGNNGTLTNGPTFTGSDFGAIRFDGVDDYVTLPDKTYPVTSPISYNVFTNIGANAVDSFSSQPLISWGFTRVYIRTSTNILKIRVESTTATEASTSALGSGSFNPFNISATYSGWNGTNATLKIYLNGVPSGEATITNQPTQDYKYYIGTYSENGTLTGKYNGKINVAQIYNKVLSQFDVWQNFNAYKSRYGIPDIVTDGLVLNLDAGNPYSYLSGSSGTTWSNTVAVSSSISGTLTNGPVYSNGTITFDGSNDYINLPSTVPLNNVSQFSYSAFVRFTGSAGASGNAFFSYGTFQGFSNDILFAWGKASSQLFFQINSGSDGSADYSYTPTNTWVNVSVVYNGTLSTNSDKLKVYINGINVPLSFTYTVPSTTFTYINPSCFIGSYTGFPSTWFFTGNIANTLIYNRALSAQEALQNFNALRGRYGI